MGRITQRTIDEIRERVPVWQVASRYVQLKRSGRDWKGLSPFNKERTPSFLVNDDRYHCFSSGRHGTGIDLVMEIEGLSFPEAVERLAAEAGIDVTREGLERETSESKQARTDALGALDAAQRFFVGQLRAYTPAQEYLKARGITGRTARDFGIGWAPPPGRDLLDHLADEGYTIGTMVDAGLAVHDSGRSPRSFFHGRITFPIRNRNGKVISFGARSIDDSLPKYVNGRDSALFSKSSAIFHIDQARRPIARLGYAVLLEGYFDVAAVCQAGIENVCATMGTALTVDHLHKLWRICPTIVVCYDGDAAGGRAADRSLETCLPWLTGDRRVAFARLPAGYDPDDLVRASGRDAFHAVTRSAEHPADALWRILRTENPGTDPADFAAIETRAKSRLSVVADEPMRRAMMDSVLSRLRGLRTGKSGPAGVSLARRVAAAIPAREAALVLAALLHPQYVDSDLEAFATAEVRTPLCVRLRDLVVGRIALGQPIDVESVARDVAVLRSALPDPEPSFVSRVSPDEFRAALNMQAAQSTRRRLSQFATTSA